MRREEDEREAGAGAGPRERERAWRQGGWATGGEAARGSVQSGGCCCCALVAELGDVAEAVDIWVKLYEDPKRHNVLHLDACKSFALLNRRRRRRCRHVTAEAAAIRGACNLEHTRDGQVDGVVIEACAHVPRWDGEATSERGNEGIKFGLWSVFRARVPHLRL